MSTGKGKGADDILLSFSQPTLPLFPVGPRPADDTFVGVYTDVRSLRAPSGGSAEVDNPLLLACLLARGLFSNLARPGFLLEGRSWYI